MTHSIQNKSIHYCRIALVSGYHPCSFPPANTYDAGLKYRFAVIFDSYRPDKDGMFFDAEFFLVLAEAILRVIPHDSLEIEVNPGTPVIRSFSMLKERYASEQELERDPPTRIKVYSGDRLVAAEETEFWSQVGGPAPYHDSFTLSFYTAEDKSKEFHRICEAIGKESGVTITAFHEGVDRKEPFVTWWKRPLR